MSKLNSYTYILKLLENPATYHLYILLNLNHIELFADKLPISLS